MAQVAQTPELRARIDGFLDYALDEWESVPEYAAEFPSWDESQQLAFVHEWGIRESALESLSAYAARGALIPEQSARFSRLLHLVAEHHATMTRLLADSEPSDRPKRRREPA
jgi:hypothetical protein